MKRTFLIAVAGLALLYPTAVSAQDWVLVYRPELRGMVGSRVQTAATKSVKHTCACCNSEEADGCKEATCCSGDKTTAAAEAIRRHEAMAAGLRGNPWVAIAALDHCDRLIAEARSAIRHNH
jgi:hypothetical protein